MSDKKSNDYNADVLLADAMLRITALENILLQKGLITKDELKRTTDVLVEKITKVVISRLDSSKNLDDFIVGLGDDLKKDSQN